MQNSEPLTEEQQNALHVAGATVRHGRPFDDLPSLPVRPPLSQEQRMKWVAPFYHGQWLGKREPFTRFCREATRETAVALLTEFDWRSREVGALIVAVREFSELQEVVSHLLLKSEVCFVGATYCLTLAVLGSEEAHQTLCRYLAYYLGRPDLWYDQGDALAALGYLDQYLGRDAAAGFQEPWREFTVDKDNWRLEGFQARFQRNRDALLDIQRSLTHGF